MPSYVFSLGGRKISIASNERRGISYECMDSTGSRVASTKSERQFVVAFMFYESGFRRVLLDGDITPYLEEIFQLALNQVEEFERVAADKGSDVSKIIRSLNPINERRRQEVRDEKITGVEFPSNWRDLDIGEFNAMLTEYVFP